MAFINKNKILLLWITICIKGICSIISYLTILDNTVSQTDLLRLSFLYFCLHFSNLTDERASLIREIALSNLFRMHPSRIIGKQTNKSPISRSTRNDFFQSLITIFSFQFTLFSWLDAFWGKSISFDTLCDNCFSDIYYF